MAIAFVAATGSANGTDTESGTISVPMPSSTVGHCVVVSVGVQLSKTVTTPAGWTLVRSQVNGTITGYQFVRVLTGTEPSTLAVTTSSSSLGGCYWSAVAYSGVSSGVPINISGSGTAGSGASPTCSLTTTAANCQIVAFEFTFGSGGTTNTITSSYTMRTANNATSTNGLLGGTGDKPAATAGTFTATGNSYSSISVIVAVALQPTSPPSAPTLTAPANASYQDLAAGFTFTWTHNGTYTGGTQTQYAIRRKISGAGSYEYWNAGTNAWQSTLIYNVSTSSSLTFGAALWTDGNIYNWSVSTKDAGGTSPFAADNTVTASAAPTVVVTAPTGTIATSTAAVTWTETLQSGAAQTAYRVIVEYGSYGTTPGAGTQVYDSGLITSATTSQTASGFVNTQTHRAFVQITETGGQTSIWAYTTFTVSLVPPATPSLTAVASTDPTTSEPRVTLTVTGHDSGPTFTYANTAALVEYSDDGGTTWATVRGATAAVMSSSDIATVYDYETPLGGTRAYRATIIGTAGSNVVASATVTASATVPATALSWLALPGTSSLSLAIDINDDGDRVRPTDQGVFAALGRTDEIIITGTQHLRHGQTIVQLFTAADRTKLKALIAAHLTSATPLLLRQLPDDGITAGENVFLAVVGATPFTRAVQSNTQDRLATIPWVEQNRPAP